MLDTSIVDSLTSFDTKINIFIFGNLLKCPQNVAGRNYFIVFFICYLIEKHWYFWGIPKLSPLKTFLKTETISLCALLSLKIFDFFQFRPTTSRGIIAPWTACISETEKKKWALCPIFLFYIWTWVTTLYWNSLSNKQLDFTSGDDHFWLWPLCVIFI